MKTPRVYFDNVAESGRITGDLPPAEMKALQSIKRLHDDGKLKLVTSRESWREQERTQDPGRRATLQAARGELSVVPNDHVVLGFFSPLTNRYGSKVIAPIATDIVDDALFADLRGRLEESDAKHLMYAAANGCAYFVTLDPDFLDQRSWLEARCPSIRIRTLLELATELRGVHGG